MIMTLLPTTYLHQQDLYPEQLHEQLLSLGIDPNNYRLPSLETDYDIHVHGGSGSGTGFVLGIDQINALRSLQSGEQQDFCSDSGLPINVPDLKPSQEMNLEPWLHAGPLTPRSGGRLNSLSPPSAGPASPYSQHSSNPQVDVSDAMLDGYHGMPSNEELYQMAKAFPSDQDTFMANYPNYAFNPSMKPRLSGARPRPISVASSIASTGDMPVTPAEPTEDDRRQKTAFQVPKLDRTMTDVYSDELYSPSFTIGSTSSGQVPVSPNNNNELFAQALKSANSHHLTVHPSVDNIPRERSPFRQGAPLAPVPGHEFPSTGLGPSQVRFGSAHHLREHRQTARDAEALQQQMDEASQATPPQTISPKDAMLDYHETDGDSTFPLFPASEVANFNTSQSHMMPQTQQPFSSVSLESSPFSPYLAQSVPSISVPQHYPFIPDHQHSPSSTTPNRQSLTPARQYSELSSVESTQSPRSPQRPTKMTADGGTYTCTYHGCTLRFDTPALLQKHKREGHRQAHGLNSGKRSEPIGMMTENVLDTQAGPHRCDRINPSTGKPCNTVFSRPYDLTRHEDTIHNARKQKVRCDLCTEEKSFSRADALTRHYRVCHPDVEFHGKQRRRAHAI